MKMKRKEPTGTIYVISSDSDEAVYVGATMLGLDKRLYHHLSAGRRGLASPIARWMATYADSAVIEAVMPKVPYHLMKAAEFLVIRFLMSAGYRLLNVNVRL